MLDGRHETAGLASKLAGRLQFTTSLSADRVGRSFIKAIHAQSRNPSSNQHVGNWLLWSQKLWLQLLQHDAKRTYGAEDDERPVIHRWGDAAG